MNGLTTKKQYEMQEVVNLVGDLALNAKSLNQMFSKCIGKVNDLESGLETVKEDISYLKSNVGLNYQQCKRIKDLVSERVHKLLGVKQGEEITAEKRVELEKYRPLFYSRCYHDVRKEGRLKNPTQMTETKYYDDVLKDIEAWIPHGGVSALKQEADEKAVARMIAKQQGY